MMDNYSYNPQGQMLNDVGDAACRLTDIPDKSH